jgi:hypothetical protein
MHPAQRVLADIEQAGIVADDHSVGHKAMGFDVAPQGFFDGDANWIGRNLERRDAEPVEMCPPRDRIRESLVLMLSADSMMIEDYKARLRI